MSEIAASSNEIPVAPPSIKSFVSRKPLKPKEAEKIPMIISIKFFKFLLKEITNCRYSFASSYLEGFPEEYFCFPLNFWVAWIIISAIKELVYISTFFPTTKLLSPAIYDILTGKKHPLRNF